MIEHEIIKRIAVISERSDETVELNYIKWGNNPPKYDLRRWADDSPLKGITLSEVELEELYWAIAEELGYDIEDDSEEYIDEDIDEVIESEEEDLNIDHRSFFVMKTMYECNIKGHECFDVVASVPMMKDSEFYYLEFPAVYCADCNVYYISEDIYNDLKKRGKVLCQILSEDEYKKYMQGASFNELNPKGPLALLGYTVAKGIYTDAERKQLLSWIIGNDIMTRKLVIYYLEMFIKMRQGQTNQSEAVRKWREDMDFIKGVESVGKNAPPMGVAKFVKGKPVIHG